VEKMFKRLLFGAGLDETAGDWSWPPESGRLLVRKKKEKGDELQSNHLRFKTRKTTNKNHTLSAERSSAGEWTGQTVAQESRELVWREQPHHLLEWALRYSIRCT